MIASIAGLKVLRVFFRRGKEQHNATQHNPIQLDADFLKDSVMRCVYNPNPKRLLAWDLVRTKYSWEAILQGTKSEYLGLNSNIQGIEIYSLGPQVSIITPQK